MPRRRSAPTLKWNHRSIPQGLVESPATRIICRATCLRLLAHSPSDASLPVRPPFPNVCAPHRPAGSKVLASECASRASPLFDKTALLPFPSLVRACALRLRPAAAPATEAAASENLLRPPGGSAECGRRTVRETLRTAGPGALLPPRASPRTSAPSPDTVPAIGPQTRRKSARLPLRSESPAPGFRVRSDL